MSHPASRRGFLLGLGSISAAGGAGVALPAIAAAAEVPTGPHPDQALLDAEAVCQRATAAAEVAKKASNAASLAFHDAVGTSPEDLTLQTWEERAFVTRTSGRFVGGVKVHVIPNTDTSGDWIAPTFAWSAEGLARAIALAPGAFGRAGTTPNRIRHWRSLMPVAAQFDAHVAAAERRFGHKELSAESRKADTARRWAETRLHRIPATTVEGLAVHTRVLATSNWYRTNSSWTTLLQSAAAITGVALNEPEFDAAGWVTAWRNVGGRVEWRSADEQWAFVSPASPATTQAQGDEVRRLSDDRGRHDAIIHRWLESTR